MIKLKVEKLGEEQVQVTGELDAKTTGDLITEMMFIIYNVTNTVEKRAGTKFTPEMLCKLYEAFLENLSKKEEEK